MGSMKSKALAVLAVALIAIGAYALGSGTSLLPPTAQASPSLFNEDAVTAIYESASPAVVEITVSETGADRLVPTAQGSGFLVDTDGNILTNNHVIDGAAGVRVTFKGGKTVDATIAGTDKTNDLAVVKVDSSAVAGIIPLEFGDSGTLKPGQMAIALGSPYGLDGTITVGVVSGLNRTVSGSSLVGTIQTDAAINHGNSGGPLLNSQGQVIGINTAIESKPGAVGIGYAVASDVARQQLPDLIAGKTVTRPWLGISGVALTKDLAGTLVLPVDTGVYIVTVIPDSPADLAGLNGGGTDSAGDPGAGGDVITTVDGEAVASVQEISSYLVANKKTGDTVSLTVLRDGASLEVSVTLGTWPENTTMTVPLPDTHPDVPTIPWPWGR